MSEWSRLDRALRDLTQAEPPRHLHARVMARIEGIAAPEAAGWQIRWGAAFAVPALIAAALIAAVWISRAPESVPPIPSVSLAHLFNRGVRLQPDLVTSGGAVVSPGLSRATTPVRQPRRAAARQAQTVLAQQDPDSSIPADERPQSIAIADISAPSVEVSGLETVTELTIAPLTVDPLAVPDPNQP